MRTIILKREAVREKKKLKQQATIPPNTSEKARNINGEWW
jgi:hypothetical protein